MKDKFKFDIRRKFRWTYEATDKDGNVVFPACFVKISKRPDFPYMLVADANGGKEVSVEGDIKLTQYFDGYDTDEEMYKKIAEYNNGESMAKGVLTMYDGCGTEMEKWTFQEVLCSRRECDGTIEWMIEYKMADYKSVGF